MEALRNASLLALLSLLLTLAPLVMAVLYLIRPSERRLALMRPISLAGLFAALTGTAVGAINVLVGLGTKPEFVTAAAIGAAEALVPLLAGFGCLTVAWLLVAAGMGRQRD
jgi:hypothetical protein